MHNFIFVKLTKPVKPEDVVWLKDGKPIPKDDTRYEVIQEQNSFTLKVKKTTLEDAGTYTVIVKNKPSTADLSVDGKLCFTNLLLYKHNALC